MADSPAKSPAKEAAQEAAESPVDAATQVFVDRSAFYRLRARDQAPRMIKLPYAVMVMDLTPQGGQVSGVYLVTNPDKLSRVRRDETQT